MEYLAKKLFSFIAWEPCRPVTLLNYVQYIHSLTCHPPGVKKRFYQKTSFKTNTN